MCSQIVCDRFLMRCNRIDSKRRLMSSQRESLRKSLLPTNRRRVVSLFPTVSQSKSKSFFFLANQIKLLYARLSSAGCAFIKCQSRHVQHSFSSSFFVSCCLGTSAEYFTTLLLTILRSDSLPSRDDCFLIKLSE